MSSSGAVRGGATFTQGTFAARPAAAPNILYYATDTGEWWVSNAAGNAWQSLAKTSAANWLAGTAGTQVNLGAADGGVDVLGAGQGLRVAEGSNAKQGVTGAMSAGAVTVANTSVTASSRIFVCRNPGGTNAGAWYVSAQTAGTSFVATSTNAADTGTGVYIIFEPG